MAAADARDEGLVLGVDGGGTKTLAILADPSGRVVGWGRAGNCDVYSNRTEAVNEVEAAVSRALVGTGRGREDIAAAVYSLVGADWPEDFAFWQEALAERRLGRRIQVVNDAVGALNAVTARPEAVAVVCGTGAAICSRNAAGEIWHSSFWQLTQGGAELSAAALQAVYRSALGIDPPTRMTERILAHFGLASVEALLHRQTCRAWQHLPKPKDLVPLLFEEAEEGDAASLSILEAHGANLAESAAAAARRVGIAQAPFDLVLAGGVFRNSSPVMRRSFLAHLARRAPRFHVLDSRHEPIRGAVMMALEAAGTPRSAAEIRYDATSPATDFFHTATVRASERGQSISGP